MTTNEVIWVSNDKTKRLVLVEREDRAKSLMAGSAGTSLRVKDGRYLIAEHRVEADALGVERWEVDGTLYRVGPDLAVEVAERALAYQKRTDR